MAHMPLNCMWHTLMPIVPRDGRRLFRIERHVCRDEGGLFEFRIKCHVI